MKTDRLDRSPMHLLHRASQCAEILFYAEMPSDLTPRQFAVLVTVSQHQGLNQADIVERTGIDRSTVADIVRRMQRKGLLDDAAHRRTPVPTPSGLQMKVAASCARLSRRCGALMSACWKGCPAGGARSSSMRWR